MNRNEGVFVNVANSPYVQQPDVAPATDNSSTRSPKERYKNVLFMMGAIELITGTLCIILGIATLGVAFSNPGYYELNHWYESPTYYRHFHTMTYPSQGIWGGVFAIVVGILGARAKSNPSQCMYNANMATSILGAFFMGMLTILSGIAAATTDYRVQALVVIHSILTVVGFIAMIVMIIHSAYCCAGVCCHYKSYQEIHVSYHPGSLGMQQPQLIQLANGQYMLAPLQMMASLYPATQFPVSSVSTAYHQPIPEYVPADQSLQSSGIQTQVAPDSSSVIADAPQTVAPATQQTTNPQPADQAGKEQEANADPPEYSTLPKSE